MEIPNGSWANPLRRLNWGTNIRQGLLACLSLVGCLALGSRGVPAAAAERVVLSYGPLERSIRVSDLETFAETGALSSQLSSYAELIQLSDENLGQIATLLKTSAPEALNQVAVAQFLYTPQGKLLLKRASLVIQTASGRAGFSATRAALILAAADGDGGLTVLNFLKHFPGDAIYVDLAQGLALAASLNQTLAQSAAAIALVQSQAALEAGLSNTTTSDTTTEATANLTPGANEDRKASSSLTAVTQPSQDVLIRSVQQYGFRTQTVTINQALAPMTLYLPEPLAGNTRPAEGWPIVMISHGLGGNRNTFAYLAEYLATSGFAVAVLEHTGSNDRQLFALLEGMTREVVPDQEFQDRPQEITLALNTLEYENIFNPDLRGKLNLDQVGLFGQSFGGYTALALAGADFDFQGLSQTCSGETPQFNLSLLLQCQVLDGPLPPESLADPRIDAVFVVNPIGSQLFGETGYANITIPLMVVGGTADTVAPAYPEQIRPFTWLTTPERYLLLIGRGTHFSTLAEAPPEEQALPIPSDIIGPRPDIARDYMEVLNLAFFQVYLQEDERFRALLEPSYVMGQLSEDVLPLSLTTQLTAEMLEAALADR